MVRWSASIALTATLVIASHTSSLAIAATPAARGDDWNTASHDMQRTGYDTQPNPVNASNVDGLTLRWKFASGSRFWASPTVVNGVVYIADMAGTLSALRASDGTVIWQHNLGSETVMTPALYDGILFIGTHTPGGALFAFDPVTGKQLWARTVAGGFRGSPVVIDGKLLIPTTYGDRPWCEPGGVLQFDERTGTQSPGWLTEASVKPDGGAVFGSLTYTGSSVVFGTGNTCQNNPLSADAIVAIDSQMMTQWFLPTAVGVTDDDVASGVLDIHDVAYISAKNGYLYAIDLHTGLPSWSVWLGAPDVLGGFATPGYVRGTLFASRGYTVNPYYAGPTNPGGALYGLTLAGKMRWLIPTKNIVLGQVVGANDVAYAELDNSINALDPESGKILWSYVTQGNFEASPAIVPSGLFVADMAGTLYAFGLPSKQL